MKSAAVESSSEVLAGSELFRVTQEIIDTTPVVDIHTHLFPSRFGALLSRGIDELLTYHYLEAEFFRFSSIRPSEYFERSQPRRADLIWKTLFIDSAPISEAARGVVAVLQALGLDSTTPNLDCVREYFRDQTLDRQIERVFDLAGVQSAVMTNDPLDPSEIPYWQVDSECVVRVGSEPRGNDRRFRSALRLDRISNLWPEHFSTVAAQGYSVDEQLSGNSIAEVRRFLHDWSARMQPVYMAVSLPDTFAHPAADVRGTLLTRAVLPVARELGLPLALMIGVRRQVNPALRLAGDASGRADLTALERLCFEFPDNRFLVSVLSRENQHELCVYARKFSNLMPFGCWWFLNNGSVVEEITRERLEMLDASFIPQHSDARVLEQLIYKWRNARRTIGPLIAAQFERLAEDGRPLTRQDIGGVVALVGRTPRNGWAQIGVGKLAPESQATISAPAASPRTAAAAVGRYRWRICALLFFATTINYVDRQVLGVLAPHLQQVIGWNEIQYGYIVAAFQGAYAIGLLAMGGVIDRLGTRLGYALAILLWSVAAIGHAWARSVAGFAAARFLLGLGESGNFPAAVKTVAEWFPQKERSFATGVFNSGTNAGAILAPLLAPWIALRFGWQWAFVFTGFFSAIWLVAWLVIYRQPSRRPRPAEPGGGVSTFRAVGSGKMVAQALPCDGPAEASERISWMSLVAHRQAWAFLIGKLVTDPIWWFFLFWLPKFLNARHGLTFTNLGLPLVAIYLSADAGSIAAGWLASWLLQRGWSVNRARKTAMLCCALAVLPVTFAAKIDSLWGAVALIGLAAAAHQGWSRNLLTLTSDLFPRRAVASVTGFGGFGGAVSGMAISNVVGFLLQFTGSYVPVFLMAGFAYLVALAAIQLLVPRLEPAGL